MLMLRGNLRNEDTRGDGGVVCSSRVATARGAAQKVRRPEAECEERGAA
ncbi:hypothetical protein PF005_g16661 [Phytophthora fragariae]|uniref:Uncharacterized protein n=2 Tax=Phytophthora TaxID=4783 RepID=A0A6A3EIX7_9STRA|nr:hypothetical protein PF003_g1646 [Phytophthora fragariae]KAE9299181.1 hypothetical protein PR003_g23065 [Phytophthora rubi]KAE8932453.1 hypothetical protein PF009_g17514 [Phytophthora fragariae]KAE8998289.1 hypothetical protein PF011_g15115 [Phytophthora fragariae]KAE9096032.1 hypothetical protein PF010_g16483 [Phytophthora fragariae]